MFGKKKKEQNSITMNPNFDQDSDLEGDMVSQAFGMPQNQQPQVQYQPTIPVQSIQALPVQPIRQAIPQQPPFQQPQYQYQAPQVMQPQAQPQFQQQVQQVKSSNARIVRSEMGDKGFYYLVESTNHFSLGDININQ